MWISETEIYYLARNAERCANEPDTKRAREYGDTETACFIHNDHYDDGSYGESYGDGHKMETELEEMANNRALPSSKREAARKMLAEIRKGDL